MFAVSTIFKHWDGAGSWNVFLPFLLWDDNNIPVAALEDLKFLTKMMCVGVDLFSDAT